MAEQSAEQKQNDKAAREAMQQLQEQGYTVTRGGNNHWRVINRVGQAYKDSLSDADLIALAAKLGQQDTQDEDPEAQQDPENPPLFKSNPDMRAALVATGEQISMDQDGSIIIGETPSTEEVKYQPDGTVKAEDVPIFRHYPSLLKALDGSGSEVLVNKAGDLTVDGTKIKFPAPEENAPLDPEAQEEEPQQEEPAASEVPNEEPSEVSKFEEYLASMEIDFNFFLSLAPEDMLAILRSYKEE